LGMKPDITHEAMNDVEDISWLDHLSAVFCLSKRPKSKSDQKAYSVGLQERNTRLVREAKLER
jgi:hypothetical protein